VTVHAELDTRGHGLRLRGSDLHLDPAGRVPLGFVSHAGRAGSALPERAIATAATLQLVAARGARALARSAPLVATYGREFTLGQLELALFPAGNVLGAAQLRCDFRGKRIVYAPDLGGVDESAPETAAPRAQLEADTLVLGARYGDPRFSFPTLHLALQRISELVQRALDHKLTPVLYAAPLGKSQEVARHLGREGHAVRLHQLAHRYVATYRAHGVELPGVSELTAPAHFGEVIIAPPGTKLDRYLRGPARTCLISGAAADPAAAARSGADAALPLSDHADHAQLVQYALASGARRVLTLGDGAAALAAALAARGLKAEPVFAERQLPLPGLG
jgi:putative mRNA 3-end processing factor